MEGPLNPRLVGIAGPVEGGVFALADDEISIGRDPKSWRAWRMPIDGGSPVRIGNQYGWSSVSPDGTFVLVDEWFAAPPKVGVIPATGGQPIGTFDLGPGAWWRWSADSRSLLFWKTSGGVSNIWRQPLDGGEARQVTSFQSDLISDVAESRDGKKLAVARYSTTSDVVMIRDLK